MRVPSFLIFFSMLFQISKQIEDVPDESIFYQIPGRNITNYKEIMELQNITDITYLLFVYKNSSVNSRIAGGYLVNIGKQLEFIAEILKIDCNNFINLPKNNICEETSKRDSFPKLKLLVPPEYKINPYTGQRMPHRDVSFTENILSETSIYNYITKNVPSYAKLLNELDFNDFLTENYLYNKIILFTDKPNTPLMLRGISNLFFDRIEFGIVNNTQKDLIEYFKVKQFPTIIAITTNDRDYPSEKPVYYEYKGGINIKEIKEFVEKFAYPIKRYELEAQGKLTRNKTLSDIFTVLNKDTIENFFILNAEKNMMIYLALENSIYTSIEKFARQTQ